MRKLWFIILVLLGLYSCQSNTLQDTEERIPLEGFVTSQGVNLYYEIKGTGKDTIVFLHGTPSTMYAFLKDFDFLYEDFTLIFYDQRGGGRSSTVLAQDSLTWQVNVEDLEAVRNYFGIKKMNILGVSWGSGLATLYSSRYPESVNKLIFYPMKIRKNLIPPKNADPIPPLFDDLTLKRIGEIRANWENSSNPKELCDEYWNLVLPAIINDTSYFKNFQGDFCNEPIDKIRNTWKVARAKEGSLGEFDFCPILEKIDNPTMVFSGESGGRMYREWKLEWAECLPASKFVWIENAGLPWIENPDKLKYEIVKFMED